MEARGNKNKMSHMCTYGLGR